MQTSVRLFSINLHKSPGAPVPLMRFSPNVPYVCTFHPTVGSQPSLDRLEGVPHPGQRTVE